MNKDESYWLHKLATLRIDRSTNDPAPHKPLLLLVIIEMAEKGEIDGRDILLSPDLAFRFSAFWSVVAHRRKQKPEVRLPFHHLKSSEIWEPLTASGEPSPDKRLTTKIRLDPDFCDCLSGNVFRDRARRLLIETEPYFCPEERAALYGLLQIKPTDHKAAEDKKLYKTNVQVGRDARFRIEVVIVAYKHTCALTGYRMTTTEMESIVDAAHIHEFCASRNNDPCNGIALTKNAHWQFDRGLWSLTDDYRILVNKKKFSEDGLQGQCLGDFEGRKIFLPSNKSYWPGLGYLELHRKQHGFINR
jgi:putative restriction endonuclease